MTAAAAPMQSVDPAAGLLARLLPRQVDNVHRGRGLAVWLLVPLVLARLAMGANSMINTRFVATGPDAIPLSTYDPAGAQAVIALFALAGLSHLLLGLQGLVVLVRYRALVPLFYLLLLVQALGARALLVLRPIVPAAPGFGAAFSLVLLAATVVGLVLSLAPPAARSQGAR